MIEKNDNLKPTAYSDRASVQKRAGWGLILVGVLFIVLFIVLLFAEAFFAFSDAELPKAQHQIIDIINFIAYTILYTAIVLVLVGLIVRYRAIVRQYKLNPRSVSSESRYMNLILVVVISFTVLIIFLPYILSWLTQ